MATQPSERTLETEMFGRNVTYEYSETWVGYSMLSLRLVMAWVFLQAGIAKWADGGFGEPLAWSSEGFLRGMDSANPLSGMFTAFADFAWLFDPLVIFGQVLIGLALLFGVFVRFAAMMGAIQMFMFWTAAWEGGLMAGFPVQNGYFIDSSFVYMLLLFGLGAFGAGRILGLDSKLEQTEIVQQNPWLRYLLG
ncbi:DoxX family protein [Natranaeroarchaeum aerophilus]|uniref:DoxX family protein n=1 Tax=Natranaeroarchaeum aerophilus TaxID=2917711 RepID=A0AAE3FR61_9EURY|nr:DoxX family protein [Natranaeroarchaeum aerophilus]MCL9813109.1 DoxX family protein [Natranaeroarchaeum aerophilus]